MSREGRSFKEKVLRALPEDVKYPPMRIGVALSGGADSVALLAVLVELGFECEALHCNFQLRGQESERDEAFVRSLCAALRCTLRTVRFDVEARMSERGESVEMACRSLRYEWFEEMASLHGLCYVAVAHHMEDNVETFFLNLLRGSGLDGVAGMRFRRGLYIRPLLGCTRPEIEAYLERRGLGFVTDSTNMSDDFRRNRLRNRVIPVLEEHFAGAAGAIARSQGSLLDDLMLLESLVDREIGNYMRSDGGVAVAEMLADFGACAPHMLFRMMRKRHVGFSASLAAEVARSCKEGCSGKFFNAGGQSFLLDRGFLLPVEETDEMVEVHIRLATPDTFAGIMSVELLPRDKFSPSRNPYEAWFDADAVAQHDLVIRPPRRGDRLSPFGMKGSRLLSDIFRDAKLSASDKKLVRVLALPRGEDGAEDTILWIPGLRASRHFPVTDHTRSVLRLTWLQKN